MRLRRWGKKDAAAALEQLCPSWPVGAHGEAMLQSWTGREAQDWLAASLKTLREWKARQIASANRWAGNACPARRISSARSRPCPKA
jgi:histidinol-phosphate/aromatic aminotransferase/cobyric acid decarboxylase-like protein